MVKPAALSSDRGEIGPQPDTAGQFAGRLELGEPLDLFGRGDIMDFDDSRFPQELSTARFPAKSRLRRLGPPGFPQGFESRGGLGHDPGRLAVRPDFHRANASGHIRPLSRRLFHRPARLSRRTG